MKGHITRYSRASPLRDIFERCWSALPLSWIGWIVCVAFCVACHSTSNTPLYHQTYVWQRVWTSEVGRAMDELGPSVAGWHVLVAESDAPRRWTASAPVPNSDKPMTAVIRIDGSRLLADSDWLTARVKAWLDSQPPGRWSGVEIDYDCPSRQLPVYGRFLQTLRAVLPARMTPR